MMNARGKVKWFDDRKGFGFIVTDGESPSIESDVFVHYTAVAPDEDGYRTLLEGQRVRFEVVEGKGGRVAASNVELDGAGR